MRTAIRTSPKSCMATGSLHKMCATIGSHEISADLFHIKVGIDDNHWIFTTSRAWPSIVVITCINASATPMDQRSMYTMTPRKNGCWGKYRRVLGCCACACWAGQACGLSQVLSWVYRPKNIFFGSSFCMGRAYLLWLLLSFL